MQLDNIRHKILHFLKQPFCCIVRIEARVVKDSTQNTMHHYFPSTLHVVFMDFILWCASSSPYDITIHLSSFCNSL